MNKTIKVIQNIFVKIKEFADDIFHGRNFGILLFLIFFYAIFNLPTFYEYNLDEIHSWNLTQNFNLIDIARLMRYEGHTVIWYYILKPFTYFDIFYPWIMKWLNLAFLFAGCLILWKKAPFHPFIKTLIILSAPIINIYSVIARCYTLGIMFIFLLAALYKDRLKYPIIYAFLIFITANTSLMACVGAFAFGILFFKDLVVNYAKNKTDKKSLIYVILIAVLTLITLYIQWHNPIMPHHSSALDPLIHIRGTLDIISPLGRYITLDCIAILTMSVFLYFKRNALCFFIITEFILLGIFFFMYAGWAYHHFFLFIYFIAAYWIAKSSNEFWEIPISKWTFIISLILFLSLSHAKIKIFKPVEKLASIYSDPTPLIKDIPEGSIIYMDTYDQAKIVHLNKKYDLRAYSGKPITSFEVYSTVWPTQESDIFIDTNNYKDDEYYVIIEKSRMRKAKKNGIISHNIPDSSIYSQSRGIVVFKVKN